ncbi:TenA family transcriptional regulator [Aneurinibacillus uraniidurans]|uniref:TenA family transcriptional regulator n=1 Tax=Aneurinibacillus uraniidurans TaxID=2966586 RepID=UPI00234900F4|nr:iron-containing redox enzyme family protein [Aneurinibacillus sp. B1]WCN36949.1 iron-containing redox enzyme family protein [Aneurinibacillus sp. B1]
MQFTSYEQVEQKIWEIVEEEIIQGDFMQSLLAGEWTPLQVREFALQYSYYSRNFPRVLGAAVAAVEPEDDWWVPLVDNLWDEGGRGNPAHYHSLLYHTFLTTAAPDVPTNEKYVPDYPVAQAAKEAVTSFLLFLRHATSLEAMASIGFGSELFAGKVMGLIGEGLQHPNYNKDRKLDVTFWTVHADEHEPRHYQLCKNILTRFTSPQELEHMYRAGAYITRSEARFYQGLYERMKSLL